MKEGWHFMHWAKRKTGWKNKQPLIAVDTFRETNHASVGVLSHLVCQQVQLVAEELSGF